MLGRRGENDIDQFFLAVEIGDQYLYGGIGVDSRTNAQAQ